MNTAKRVLAAINEAVSVGLHDDGSVTLLHGTTILNARDILRNGFKPGNPARVAAMLENFYKLRPGSVFNHVAFEFAKGRRDLDKIFFTTDEDVAAQYTIPEVVQDGLEAVYSMLYLKDVENMTRELHAHRATWKKAEGRKLAAPAVLEVTLPWDVIGAHAFGRHMTLPEFREIQAKYGEGKTDSSFFNNVSIPISALRGARVRLR